MDRLFDNNNYYSVVHKNLIKEAKQIASGNQNLTILKEMKPHLATLNKQHSLSITMHSTILRIVKVMLWLVECLSVSLFALSLCHHHMLNRYNFDIETTKEYFSTITPLSSLNMGYTPFYGKYKYESHRQKVDICAPLHVRYILHYLVYGAVCFKDQITSSNPKHLFCNLDNFPKVIERSNIKAAPDSYLSMSMLSTNTFIWMAYLVLLKARCSLETKAHIAKNNYIKTAILEKATESLSHVNRKELTLVAQALTTNNSTLLTTLQKVISQKELLKLRKFAKNCNPSTYLSQIILQITGPIIGLLSLFGALSGAATSFQIYIWEYIKIILICILHFIAIPRL